MKPLNQALITLVFATATGFGGYYLGKKQAGGAVVTTIAGDSSSVNVVSGQTATVSVKKKPDDPKVDLKSFLAKLEAEKDPLKRFKLALDNLEAWVNEAPEEALGWVRSQQPSARRDEILRGALNQYAEKNAKGAAAWAEKNLTGVELNNNLIEIGEHWAHQNGQEAADWFLARPATQQRDAAVESVFFAWGTDNPTSALAYLQGNSALGELAPVVQRAALAGWSKSDPEGAVNASLASSRTNKDPDQFANTLANWATLDLAGSAAWLQTNLPSGAERNAAIPELATIFAQQSPEAGVNWISQLNAGSERDGAVNRFVSTWAATDAAGAARWAAAQPATTFTPDTGSEIAQNFLMSDPAGFAAWRSSLPDGVLKTQANQVGSEQSTPQSGGTDPAPGQPAPAPAPAPTGEQGK